MKTICEKITNAIIKHRKITSFIIIVIPILVLFLMTLNKKFFTDKLSVVEFMYYLSQVILSMFAIAGTVIAVWQYYLSSKSDIRQTQLIQVQKAIDLSGYYKDNILHKLLPITYVYEQTGIMSIIDKINPCDMKKFDSTELTALLPPYEIEKLKCIQSSPEFAKAVIEANTIYNLNLNIMAKKITVKNENGNEKEQETLVVLKDSIMVSFFSGLVSDLLNNIEFFAMHFKHNTADESAVYRSLHQTYIEIMKVLYYQIADVNQRPESKYYTNAINLYSDWHKRNQEDIKKLQKEAEKLENGTVIDSK